MKIFRKKKNGHKDLIRIIIAAFAVVLFWWGVWGILDTYVFPNDKPLGYIICIVSGLILLFIDDFALDELGGNR